MTGKVDRLEADGLVRRTPHPTDRRATLIELTAASRDACQDAGEKREVITRLFGSLSPKQQADLVRSVRLLRSRLDEMTRDG